MYLLWICKLDDKLHWFMTTLLIIFDSSCFQTFCNSSENDKSNKEQWRALSSFTNSWDYWVRLITMNIKNAKLGSNLCCDVWFIMYCHVWSMLCCLMCIVLCCDVLFVLCWAVMHNKHFVMCVVFGCVLFLDVCCFWMCVVMCFVLWNVWWCDVWCFGCRCFFFF